MRTAPPNPDPDRRQAMNLTWGALALMCIAGALAWFWQDSLAAREAANAAALEACERLSLQFLDGTVAFARLSLTRERGWLRFRRTYIFDYTANSVERRQGFVLLTGRRVDSVGYARDERVRTQQPPPPEQSAQVLHLSDRRLHASDANSAPPSAPADGGARRDGASEP
jgi:hypothetical protein